MIGGFLIWLHLRTTRDYVSTASQANATSTLGLAYDQKIPDGFGTPQANPQNASTQSATTNNNQKIMNATLHTNKGDITIELFGSITPKTVENFTKLAGASFYDNVKFHRVIKNFMIQGGDPLTKDDSQAARWGTGGPGYTFEDELTPENRNMKGTISMANAGPDTNGSQFFINLNDNNFLDTKHTVFGRVIQGMDVVEAIGNVETNSADRPIEPIVIKNITLK
ncbi:MAG: peptidyl-prolyl cis-trans isomerase, peptidylprolyl isomerase [Candidatus Paceibacter sp.]|nr:peptidyl-prolyl cis-trans isomerase, peptidylprolyl isomerase [Candidatus Paceibacter sp.]